MTCPNCSALFRLEDELAGENVRCHECKTIFTVKDTTEEVDFLAVEDTPAKPDESANAEPGRGEYQKPSRPPAIATKKKDTSRKSAAARQPAKSRMGLGMVVAILFFLGSAFLGCAGIIGGSAYYYYAEWLPEQHQERIAVNNKKKTDNIDKIDDVNQIKVDKDKTSDADKKNNDRKDADNKDAPPKDKDGDKKDDKKDREDKDKDKDKDGPKKDGDAKKPPAKVEIINASLDGNGNYSSDHALTPNDPLALGKRHKLYAISLRANQTYHITMTSTQFDPNLCLQNEVKTPLSEENSKGGARTARIVYRPTNSGLHYIEAASGGVDIGQYSLTVKTISDLLAIKLQAGGDVGKSVFVNTQNLGDFVARELSLKSSTSKLLANWADPVWDPQGKFFYWLHDQNLYKVGRDGKVVAHAVLPYTCRQLAYVSDSLITHYANGNELLVIDAQSLASYSKFPQTGVRIFAGTPALQSAFVLHKELEQFDPKTGKMTGVKIGGGANLANLRSMIVTPDGKYLCVQADNKFIRYRINGNELIEEESRPAEGTRIYSFQVSPDSKIIAITSLGATKKTTKSLEGSFSVHTMQNWEKQAFTIPTPLRQVAFDTTGRLFAMGTTTELRVYPDPVKNPEKYQVLSIPVSLVRRLIVAPQGGGMIVASSSVCYLIEEKK